MMDPVTLVLVTTAAHAATRYTDAYTRRMVLRAQAELVRARGSQNDAARGESR